MKSRILITGLNSVIGWNLFKKAGNDHATFGTFRKRHPALKGHNVYRIDLDHEQEVSEFIQRIKPEYIMHARAICDLDVCEDVPQMAEKINVEGTRKILKAAAKLKNLRQFIYISTDHVFNGDLGRYDENHPPNPKHVYGRTKQAAEQLVAASGLPYLIIRPGLVLGNSLQGNVGPRDFLLSRLRAGKQTRLFTDEWRTPIQAEDLAKKILALAFSDAHGVFHLAGCESFSRYELGQILAKKEGLPLDRITPERRSEDAWAHIRPEHLTLKSIYSVPSPKGRGNRNRSIFQDLRV